MDEVTIPRWMWPLFVVASAAFLLALAIDQEALRLAFKSLPVLSLAVGVFLTLPRTRFRVLMAIGLVFGAGGDFMLELGPFVPGLLLFLVGHLFYIAAFVGINRSLRPLTGLSWLLVAVVLTLMVADGAGDLVAPVTIYALVICAMAWRASALHRVAADAVAVPIALGATLFVVSDALIAVNRWAADIPAASWWIMLTYFAGQGLIALGAVRNGD